MYPEGGGGAGVLPIIAKFYGEVLSERDTFFSLQVQERLGDFTC